MVLTLTPILTKLLEQGANPNPNFGCKLITAVFWDDFGGTHAVAVSEVQLTKNTHVV